MEKEILRKVEASSSSSLTHLVFLGLLAAVPLVVVAV